MLRRSLKENCLKEAKELQATNVEEGKNNMYYIFEKRTLWNVHYDGKLVAKFRTEDEAKEYIGWVPPVEETLNGSTEEEKSSEEEASTDKQAFVLSSKKLSKEKI